ncbi:serine/threonine kinase [Pseudoxanthomonas dokdonensis]|uniref:Serine/threonine kinase n=1 Tax=Pseudoxanthomonas dokdonensis TaxID=344882 RepID=A0A0R0CXV1_9GAMM|nr:serine/threonine kinase [Pseudoxanthomonas dokdonensis]
MKRPSVGIALSLLAALSGCTPEASQGNDKGPAQMAPVRMPSVTISGDDSAMQALTWQVPRVDIASFAEETDQAAGQDPAALAGQARKAALEQARQALADGHLYEDGQAAIPIYLALATEQPQDPRVQAGLDRAVSALLKRGEPLLRSAPDLDASLDEASRIAAVARSVRPDDEAVLAYLARLDEIEQMVRLNRASERALRNGQLGEQGGGALAGFREVLKWQPGQARAMQGMAAVESALIRRAESSANAGDFEAAGKWLDYAAQVREQSPTIADARQRVAGIRTARIIELRDQGVKDMVSPRGLDAAREKLAEVLRIAEPGNAVAADFRKRIDLATYYGLFKPGQAFTDALSNGGRGPEMVVVPHGGFTMGAAAEELGASDAEKPAHYVRFNRGFAMSRTPVTVAEFRRFVQASGYRPRASRRGLSIVYDEASGNFVRHTGVDWQSDYSGGKASDDMPVLHVSVYDAEAYAQWLAQQTGHSYRLPSEAEFEYVLRAGTQARYPWGNGQPPERFGNLTGGNDVSPSGRNWKNAFVGYGDGYWGPAPVASFKPNRWGLHGLGGNVSEWVADCWHASYRRAPADGAAWFNPGCRSRVVRGGSWASAPVQSRAAWRVASDSDITNARVGFRVVRGI